MARTLKQTIKEELATLGGIAAEAVDSARHKVVEQGWFGQEQTGYIQNIYGTDLANEQGSETTLEQEAKHESEFPSHPHNQADGWNTEQREYLHSQASYEATDEQEHEAEQNELEQ